jgi:predicted nucleic acid-binding Zn ribbon protein
MESSHLMLVGNDGRSPHRLKRCRHCGIRVPRDEMVYGFKACSDDCADEIWIREQARLESITE